MSKNDSKNDAKKAEPALVLVRSKGERFRRAGIEFTREGVEVDASKLTAEQIAAINDEPALTVDGGELVAPEKAKK